MKQSSLPGVAVLSLAFGLVGIDRFLISTMYPTIAAELHLDYGDIGVITGVLALAWGTAALVLGNLSDHVGQRLVLTVSMVIFSLLIGASGLASGLMGLVLVRFVMGFADGAFTPASIAATIKLSPPQHSGRNVGLQQVMFAVFGLGLSPLLVRFLLQSMSWRWIFSIFVIPGLVLAWLTWRIVPSTNRPDTVHTLRGAMADWRAVLAVRDVWLLMGGMLCWLTCLVTTTAFLPLYLTDYLGLDTNSMADVMSSVGFGATFGILALTTLSDRLGRKPVMLMATIGAAASLLALTTIGPNVPLLFATLFCLNIFSNPLLILTVGPLSAEAVQPALMTTASGMVIAVGEFFGGGLAPVIAGQMAQRFGIQHILWLPIAAMAIGFVLCVLLRGTRRNDNAAGAVRVTASLKAYH